MDYLKYDNVKDIRIGEKPNNVVEVEQFFNLTHFKITVLGMEIDVMLNKSTQLYKDKVFKKDILNYFAYIDEVNFNHYFDIDFNNEGKILNNEELNKEIKKQIEEGLKIKNIADKENKRKAQINYFVQKKITDKKYKYKQGE
jgi:CTP:phosphocholine cytidylyltransferase-like protein